MRKTLVLDVGGVLASNLSPGLWQQLSSIGRCEEQLLYAQYKEEISRKLWCGEITELQWWEWLAARGVEVSAELRPHLIASYLQPLPALELLPQWSKLCRIIIMSNHRTEWLNPLLQPYQSYIESIYISDQVGMCKPSSEWFHHIDKQIHGPIHFVDDSEKNISAAMQLGWQTTLADKHGNWTAAIDEWLHSQVQSP